MKKINWRYAIGELIIVTVGITFAFSLNSWAQNNRDKKKTVVYLEGILTDLRDDEILLDSIIVETDSRLKRLYSVMPYLQGKVDGRDSVIIEFFSVIDPLLFQPHQSTVQTMSRSGDLSLIEDVEFKNQLIEHYDQYRNLEKEYERHENFAKEFIAGYFMENLDYASFRAGMDASFVTDRYFRNIVYSLMGIYKLSLEKQQKAKRRLEQVIPLVESQKSRLS